MDFVGNHIISVAQFDRVAADRVFEVADSMQPYALRKKITRVLQGAILSNMFFEPSTRTRISFDLAVKQLGGKSVTLNPDEIHYGSGNESLHDTAKVLSQYADIVMLRTHVHKKVLDFSIFQMVFSAFSMWWKSLSTV